MSPVNVGIIGCGSITLRRHAPEYAANPYAKIVAVTDRVPGRAEACAATFGGTAVPTWQELVARPDIDAVSVCTANAWHAPISIAASKAGKHVLCEKPMATTAAEARAMIDAAAAAGKFLMIGHNQRLAPLHVKAKQLLTSGVIGKVNTFRSTFSHGGPEGWSIDGADSWFFNKAEAVVGSMGDLGVHKTDLMLWLLGENIVEVSAFVEHNAKPYGDVDDNAVCLLRTESGAVGTLTASWSHQPGGDNSTIIYGDRGIIRIDSDPRFPLVVQLVSGENQFYEIQGLQTNDGSGQFSTGVVDAFIDAIRTNTPPEISGTEGQRALAVVLACMDSARTKQHVAVQYT